GADGEAPTAPRPRPRALAEHTAHATRACAPHAPNRAPARANAGSCTPDREADHARDEAARCRGGRGGRRWWWRRRWRRRRWRWWWWWRRWRRRLWWWWRRQVRPVGRECD